MRHQVIVLMLAFLLPAFVAAGKPRINYKGAILKTGTGSDEKTEGVEGAEGSIDISLPVGLPLHYEEPVPAADDHSGYGGSGAASPKIVYTYELRDDVGPPSWREAQAALRQARNMKADVFLIHMNSSTASLETANNIRKGLMDFEKPVYVYFDNKASTTAKIISMGGDSVYMSPKAHTVAKAQDKKAVATGKKNSTVLLARENKVSENPQQQSPTLAAVDFNSRISRQEASSMNEVLAMAGISNYKMVQYKPGFFDRFIDFLLQPAMVFILLLLISGTVLNYLRGKAGFASLGIGAFTGLFYLTSNYLEGYARPGEILLLAASFALVFYAGKNRQARRLAGISGMVLLLGSLLLLRLNNAPVLDWTHFGQADSISGSLLLLAGAFTTAWAMHRFSILQRMSLLFASPPGRDPGRAVSPGKPAAHTR